MLNKGEQVYVIIEKFKEDYHYDVIKTVIKNVPRGTLKEYDLIDHGDIYCRKRKGIYLSREEAVEKAEEMADRYDHTWEGITGRKMKRVWREDNLYAENN